jgi:Holliday junction resolvasome RuvABC endonuclease subunit
VEIIGIDLGVRVAHVSTARHCFSVGLKPKQGTRYEEIQCIAQALKTEADTEWGSDVYAYVEEPVVAGARNLRTSLRMAQVSGAILSVMSGELVPVSTWKKAVVGKGNATKDDVRAYLQSQPEFKETHGKQDWIDATCIRLYGAKLRLA